MRNARSLALIAVTAFSSLLAACAVEDGPSIGRVEQAATEKVEVCHQTNSTGNPEVVICTSLTAVEEHLGHGDTLGNCTEPPPPPSIDAAPPEPPPPPPPVDAAPGGDPDAEVLPG